MTGGRGVSIEITNCLLWDRTGKRNSFTYIIVGLLPECAMLWDRTKRLKRYLRWRGNGTVSVMVLKKTKNHHTFWSLDVVV